jgi:hypothetical protein
MLAMDAEGLAAAGQDELALLRAHEPILAYTRGELFLPASAQRYVTLCSLRGRRGDGAQDEELVPAGELTVERLAGARAEFPGYDLALRLVQQPADRRAVRAARRQAPRFISRTAKLAAVGLLARLVDVAVRLSLVIRGSVPGGVTTEAARLHREHLAAGPRTYYGRVVRSHGYVALQYWFFYAMNDWRTTFGGLNDHEADWETMTLFLSATDLQPRWIAVASHDYTGDDLRRRWDDPDLLIVDGHPVVFVGAGSHSGAVLPGDYLVRVRPRFLTGVVHWLKRLLAWISPFVAEPDDEGIGVPYVDYARGDGTRVGPGGDAEWEPQTVSEDTPWVAGYAGLWGRDTGDRFGGERAPAGPRYERDGTIRPYWADPVGWAGLHKVPADPADLRAALAGELAALREREAGQRARLDALEASVRADGALAAALRSQAADLPLRERSARRVREGEREAAALARDLAALRLEIEAVEHALAHPPQPGDPHEHLVRPHLPHRHEQRTHRQLLQFWAAISTPLLLGGLILLLFTPGLPLLDIAVLLLVLFTGVEALARRRLLPFALTGLLLVLGAAGAYLLVAVLLSSWRAALAAVLGLAAAAVLTVNLRDLFRG